VDPWDRTVKDRWDDLESFYETDWSGDQPGFRLVEAIEALVDDCWSVVGERLAEELQRRPRLKVAVTMCNFGERVPDALRERLYRLAESD
jgi:hypothetical protein